ncbi:3-deoxy-D-manno-octulosonic acid kinase [Lysobacter sp. TY2-98]|uniref:3-deoxy-D-manno-octulosonic acid kinase n=1 Tax=Lysobacter sp. TY2-98 TaxID=2290922 RepID=UPI000E2032D6|nr:3-deoxy-D-manno-octulosonic acid kinase [Lysobacter sp. TY2-98]AXK72335.1 3-deoxy-D-manno-octulosonic acid kinase [Lysobacter sp. TY2-98]
MATAHADDARIEFDGLEGRGAIVFDAERTGQATPDWFHPAAWGARARPVGTGGRGAAWFVDAPFGACVLRQYRRGGLAARVSTSGYFWHGEARVRSVAEYHLLREAQRRGLPVPTPLAAFYERRGLRYRAAILIERLRNVETLAELAMEGGAPWVQAGRLIARMHRAGLDHADLNADNLLFDRNGDGWVIDLDRGVFRTVGSGWRQRNLTRLHRSLLKRRGVRDVGEVEEDFMRLHDAYEQAWSAS